MGPDFSANQWSWILSFWADRQVVVSDLDQSATPQRRLDFALREGIEPARGFSYSVLGRTFVLTPIQE
jgi:hypothetical protein